MTNAMRRKLLTSAATGLSAALAATAPALAQTAVAGEGAPELVVTARKSNEKLQNVPLSISVFNAKELADQGIVGLLDISERTPGFVYQTYSSSFDASPTIRGLSQFDVTSSVANVSTVVNGVYIPRNYSVDLGIADVSQIEIIKGPQSALYGGNAFAGVIDYTLGKPTAAPHADVSLTGGTAGRFDGKIDASGSFFNNALKVRGYFANSEYGGTWKNDYPSAGGHSQSLGGHNNTTYGFAVSYSPIKQIEASIDYFHLDRHEDAKPNYDVTSTDASVQFNCGVGKALYCGKLSTNPLAYASAANTRPAGLLLPHQPGFNSSTDFLDATLKAELTPQLSATYVFGHVRSYATEITTTSDNPATGFGVSYAALFSGGFAIGALTNDQKEGGVSEINSHELRFDYTLGRLKALFGLYYAAIDDTYEFNIWQAPDGQAIGGDPTHPFDFAAFPFALIGHHSVTDSTAEFGRLSYGLLDDRLTVAAEVRHSSDALNYQDIIAHVTQKATFDTTTPRFTADYKLAPGSLLYLSAAEGVKEGGFNGLTGASGHFNLLTSQQTFQPESNWTYELGTKNTLMGGALRLNADVFLVKWTNLQIQEQPLNTPAALAGVTSVITTNLGAATSYGFESDGSYAFTPHVLVNYALALVDPTFDKGTKSQRFAGLCDGSVCPTDLSVAGRTLPRTSKVQLETGATYKDTVMRDYQWNIHGEFTYQSEQQAEEMNLSQIPSRLLFNASAGLKGKNWDLTIWGKNIFNRKYVADSFFILAGSVGYGVSLGELATAGVTLNVRY